MYIVLFQDFPQHILLRRTCAESWNWNKYEQVGSLSFTVSSHYALMLWSFQKILLYFYAQMINLLWNYYVSETPKFRILERVHVLERKYCACFNTNHAYSYILTRLCTIFCRWCYCQQYLEGFAGAKLRGICSELSVDFDWSLLC